MTDNCPNCQQQSIQPAAEHHRGNQDSHLYQCPACGHIWSTNRNLGAYEKDVA
ncbi:hypothetical protein ACWCXC_31760 [Streptomyces sp. NPDC001515]